MVKPLFSPGSHLCPQCGYRGACFDRNHRTGEETRFCRACGYYAGWMLRDDIRRDRDANRAATGEVRDFDGTGKYLLARFEQPGYGVATLVTRQWDYVDGLFQVITVETWVHCFRHPLNDRAVARVRRMLEAGSYRYNDETSFTRWNGHTLEVLYGTLPPTQDEYEAAREPDRERNPDATAPWGDEDQAAWQASLVAGGGRDDDLPW